MDRRTVAKLTQPLTPPPLPLLNQLGIAPSRICHIQPSLRRTHSRAIVNWLTRYRPTPKATNLEQVKGYIEAFYHLCEIEEWERAFTLISTQLNTPTNETLHYQLRIWGYFQERTDLYNALANKVNHRGNENWNARVLQFLGESHYSQGNYAQAKACYESSLALFRNIGTAADVGMLLSAIGELYYALGDYNKAIDYQTQWLEIARKSALVYGEGVALGSLGNIYESKGDYPKAKDYHHQHLEIARQLNDLEMEGSALGNLGCCCHAMGEYLQAKNLSRAAFRDRPKKSVAVRVKATP